LRTGHKQDPQDEGSRHTPSTHCTSRFLKSKGWMSQRLPWSNMVFSSFSSLAVESHHGSQGKSRGAERRRNVHLYRNGLRSVRRLYGHRLAPIAGYDCVLMDACQFVMELRLLNQISLLCTVLGTVILYTLISQCSKALLSAHSASLNTLRKSDSVFGTSVTDRDGITTEGTFRVLFSAKPHSNI
jgi:hypothetical protein